MSAADNTNFRLGNKTVEELIDGINEDISIVIQKRCQGRILNNVKAPVIKKMTMEIKYAAENIVRKYLIKE